MVDVLILLGFIVIILLYLKDFNNLIIPAKKKNTDMIVLAIGVLLIIGITYVYGQTWLHYTVGILGAIMFVISVVRRGITSKGFIVAVELSIFGNWGMVEKVEVRVNDEIRVTINRRYGIRKEVHYYEKEDYDRINSLLSKHLPREKVKIV